MNGRIHVQKSLDVICQHKKDGNIIPIKIRLQDEDGEYQSYHIKSYRCHTLTNTPDSRRTTILCFDCKIIAFGHEQIIGIGYNYGTGLWQLLGADM